MADPKDNVASGTERRPVSYREMVDTLAIMENEEMSNFRMFGHPSRQERAQVLGAIKSVVLDHMQNKIHTARRYGR